MGELPVQSVNQMSAFDQIYYRNIKKFGVRNLDVSTAVSASACVPGFFEPVGINIYQDEKLDPTNRKIVRLTDGGVFQNDGLLPLYSEGIETVIASGGGKEFAFQPQPSKNNFAVLNDSFGIASEQVFSCFLLFLLLLLLSANFYHIIVLFFYCIIIFNIFLLL